MCIFMNEKFMPYAITFGGGGCRAYAAAGHKGAVKMLFSFGTLMLSIFFIQR